MKREPPYRDPYVQGFIQGAAAMMRGMLETEILQGTPSCAKCRKKTNATAKGVLKTLMALTRLKKARGKA